MLCLIKFGEKKYMELLGKGQFYFSHAKRFREIESELVKGQGDELEGKAQVKTTSVRAYDHDTGDLVCELPINVLSFGAELIEYVPVFCCSYFTKEDCIYYVDDLNYRINFSSEIQETIREHFPKADTAIIFTDPMDLLNNIESQLDTRLVHSKVNYFNMKPVGTDWVEFISGDSSERFTDGKRTGTKYTVTTENVYRTLLAKDQFFTDEKEYRLLLPDISINEPETRCFTIKDSYKVVDLNKLFQSGIEVRGASIANFT